MNDIFVAVILKDSVQNDAYNGDKNMLSVSIEGLNKILIHLKIDFSQTFKEKIYCLLILIKHFCLTTRA